MGATEERALIRLVSWAWGDGSKPPFLPNDHKKLAELGKIPPEEWARAGPAVLAMLQQDPVTDLLYFPEQMAQWKELGGLKAKRAEAGKRGGQKKAENAKRQTSEKAAEFRSKVDEDWERFREVYPKRDGDQAWRGAERKFRAWAAKGVDTGAIVAGAARYATWVRAKGNERTEWVKQAETFVGIGRHWEGEYTVITVPPVGTNGAAVNGKPGGVSIRDKMRAELHKLGERTDGPT